VRSRVATACAGARAGQFNGDVEVSGNLRVGAGLTVGDSVLEVRGAAVDLAPNNCCAVPVVQETSFFRVGYLCPNPTTDDGVLRVTNFTGETVDVFVDRGSRNPRYHQVSAGGTFPDQAMNAAGEFVTIQIDSASKGIATITLFTVNRATDCHAQTQVLISG
jgi:hypothetical protein